MIENTRFGDTIMAEATWFGDTIVEYTRFGDTTMIGDTWFGNRILIKDTRYRNTQILEDEDAKLGGNIKSSKMMMQGLGVQ